MRYVPPSGIAVIETRWEKHSDISIKPLIDTACQMFDTGPMSFHYEMFCSKVALEEAIPRIIAMRHIKYLYIASHGTSESLKCYNEDTVGTDDFADLLKNSLSEKGVSLQGAHLGVCEFGAVKNLTSIISHVPKLSWISGYSQKADWLGSAALDMQFFYHIMASGEDPRQKIEEAANVLKRHASGACSDFGLSVLMRNTVQASPKNLMDFE